MQENIFILSVGGSLIYPDDLDTLFLKQFKRLIIKHVKRGKRFVIVTGGGKISRNYQNVAKEIGHLDPEDLDWLGIHGTRLNAHLFRTIFKEYAYPKVIKNPNKKINFSQDILIGAGWKPGSSTDYIAVLIARQLKIPTLINLTNIDFVYDRDPKIYHDAKPLKEMTWKEFRQMFGTEWNPGMNSPFDPVASRYAENLGITVHIINGNKMNNLDNLLSGRKFIGTSIKS